MLSNLLETSTKKPKMDEENDFVKTEQEAMNYISDIAYNPQHLRQPLKDIESAQKNHSIHCQTYVQYSKDKRLLGSLLKTPPPGANISPAKPIHFNIFSSESKHGSVEKSIRKPMGETPHISRV